MDLSSMKPSANLSQWSEKGSEALVCRPLVGCVFPIEIDNRTLICINEKWGKKLKKNLFWLNSNAMLGVFGSPSLLVINIWFLYSSIDIFVVFISHQYRLTTIFPITLLDSPFVACKSVILLSALPKGYQRSRTMSLIEPWVDLVT